jgi:signal transduction histidine kinase
MASRTAQPLSASFPSEPLRPTPQLLELLARLVEGGKRRENARALARHLEADELLIFVRDPDISVLLPAPGFPQSLPRGRLIRELVQTCEKHGQAQGDVAFPDAQTLCPARALSASDGSVVLLIGGTPRMDEAEALCQLLPLVAAALRVEQRAKLVHSQAQLAEEAARRAQTLAARLDTTRQELQRALHAAERSRRHSAFLAEAAGQLASSLEPQASLGQVAALTVPLLADWCLIDLARAQGFERVAVGAGDPAEAPLAAKLLGPCPTPADAPAGPWHAMRGGGPEVSTDISAAVRLGIAGDEFRLGLIETVQFHRYLCLPIVARGRTLGTLTFLFVTARPGLPEADLALAADLAGRIGLTLDNIELYRSVQQALQIRDDFISIAAHELRTPLSPLQLTLQSMQASLRMQDAQRIQPPALLQRVDVAVRQTERLTTLINNLLDVSRLRAGGPELHLEEVDLSEVAHDAVHRCVDEAGRVGSRIEVIASVPVWGNWDRLRLEQMASNLLSNAIKYGGGHPIEVRVEAEGDRARLSVRDHGIGISLENQERIFRRFERAVPDRYTTGFGLGLWIVSELARALGGKVEVKSELGAGSTFSLVLPRG